MTQLRKIRLPGNFNMPAARPGQAHPALQNAPSSVQKRGGAIPTGGGTSNVPGTGLLPVSFNGNERTLVAEVSIPQTSQTSVPFPDLQTLLGKRIIAIESFSVVQVPKGPVTGLTNWSAAAQQDGFIQLNDATNTALMDRHCSVDFNPQLNNGRIRDIDYTNIVWTNSKIFFSQTTNLVAGTIAYFVIHYLNEG
jgi:hypothetical protein